jgi:hypothetical protein
MPEGVSYKAAPWDIDKRYIEPLDWVKKCSRPL